MPHGTEVVIPRTLGLRIGALLSLLGCGDEPLPIEGRCFSLSAVFADSLYTGAMDSLETAAPSRVHLTDRQIRDQGGHAAWAIDSIAGATPSVHTWQYWMTPHPDSVVLVFSTGFAGVALRLQRGGEVLHGVAESFFDYRSGDVTLAAAQSVPCDAPVPPSERYTTRFVGEVALLGHQEPIRIDEPLDTPAIAVDSVSNTIVYLRAEPSGMLRGGSSIVVGTQPGGVVRSIDVSFPSDVRLSDVVKQLEAELGPPTAERAWIDRVFAIHVSERRDPMGSVQVNLSRSRGH